MDKQQVEAWIAEVAGVLRSVKPQEVVQVLDALLQVCERGGTIFVIGNGGSATTANHFALDLQKAASSVGRPVRALSLADNVGLITAWGNDTSFDRVFAEQLQVLGRQGDGLILFSVSGSSPNLLAALQVANEKGMTTVGLLGKDGGAARAIVDWSITVPVDDYGWVESTHVVLEHILTYALRETAIPSAVSHEVRTMSPTQGGQPREIGEH